MEHVAGKTLIVTGAGSGFGRLVSTKAAANGAKVVCADINAGALSETVDSITSTGGDAVAQLADVTDLAAMRVVCDRAVGEYSGVDVLVNNAGVMPLAFYADHADAYEAWSRCIDINIKGVLNGIVAVYDQMIAQGRGHVINLSSIYGNFPVVGAGVYGATKAAVNVLSESLRVESQGKIKVTIVKPTGIPATNLGAGVINPEAIVGILGQNASSYGAKMQALAAGELDPRQLDADNIEYVALDPEHLADQILYAINQPWGVSIGDITVRASGDGYVL
jgi:NADP-dependent 3-hydroxy acid dehydrogenase YdfG